MRKNVHGKRMLAAMIGCLMLPAAPVHAQEKGFDYYHALSDDVVYREFCEMYGEKPSQTMPHSVFLPCYWNLVNYIGEDPRFMVMCAEDDAEVQNLAAGAAYNVPELFGFPESMQNRIQLSRAVYIQEIDGVRYQQYEVVICFDEAPIYTNTIADIYRIWLTLYHSDFYQQYCLQSEGVECLKTIGGRNVFGDISDDGVVNAEDASLILIGTAAEGAGKNHRDAGISNRNWYISDVNDDGQVDATDASSILQYAAATGVGYADRLEVYMYGTE